MGLSGQLRTAVVGGEDGAVEGRRVQGRRAVVGDHRFCGDHDRAGRQSDLRAAGERQAEAVLHTLRLSLEEQGAVPGLD
jgi:hypothetical protein